MAILAITVQTPDWALPGVSVVVELTDSRGNSTIATPGAGVYVARETNATDQNGYVEFDLTPNADITPAGTFYTVSFLGCSFLIEKGSGTETLGEAIVY